MMRFPFVGWFLFNVQIKCQGIVLIAKGKGSSIECSSNEDLTFKLYGNIRNTAFNITIAECDAVIHSCRLLEPDMKNTYTISYTGRGGILQINHESVDTYGTYECYETFQPMNSGTVDVIMQTIDDGETVITDYSGNGKIEVQSDEERTYYHLFIVSCFLVVIVIVVSCAITYIIIRKKVSRMTKRQEPSAEGPLEITGDIPLPTFSKSTHPLEEDTEKAYRDECSTLLAIEDMLISNESNELLQTSLHDVDIRD